MTTNPRCVLVDDDPDFISFAHVVLDQIVPDSEVMEFHNGIDALEYLSRNHVDLIITDFRMPELDGLRLTVAIRSFDAKVPILVMSGEEKGCEALACGASAFLPKRSLLAELGSTLEQIGSLPIGLGVRVSDAGLTARPAPYRLDPPRR